MALNVFSNCVMSWPPLTFIAPNKAMDLRVGAKSWIGSISSGGTHILIHKPCCWKWHSSRLHKSMPRSFARLCPFFKSCLLFWVSFSNQWARFTKSKTQVTKNTLTCCLTLKSTPQDYWRWYPLYAIAFAHTSRQRHSHELPTRFYTDALEMPFPGQTNNMVYVRFIGHSIHFLIQKITLLPPPSPSYAPG